MNINDLINQASAAPKLVVDRDAEKFLYNIRTTIKAVEERLKYLRELEGEIDYSLTMKDFA